MNIKLIEKWLKIEGNTKMKFCVFSDISLSTLYKILNGDHKNLTIEKAIKIAELLGVSLDTLVGKK